MRRFSMSGTCTGVEDDQGGERLVRVRAGEGAEEKRVEMGESAA
jgi:hypothetical protein